MYILTCNIFKIEKVFVYTINQNQSFAHVLKNTMCNVSDIVASIQ